LVVYAHMRPIVDNVNKNESQLYRILEIHMQRLGHLIPYRENLNWDSDIFTMNLGNTETLQKLKKTAAKNDGVLLMYAKLTKGTVFQHLICHPNNEGIYLPFHFDEPFYIKNKNKKIWIGSASRLHEELNWLRMTMESTSSDVQSYWSNLLKLCKLSTEKCSPIILNNNEENSNK
jgi:hypothetical protein